RADWVVQASEEHIRFLEAESDDAFARPRRPSWAEGFRDTIEGGLVGTLDAVALLRSDVRDCFGRAVEPRDRVVETPLILSAFRVRQQVENVVAARRCSLTEFAEMFGEPGYAGEDVVAPHCAEDGTQVVRRLGNVVERLLA